MPDFNGEFLLCRDYRMEIAFIVALKQTIRLPHSIQIRYDITLSSYRVFEWRMVRHRAKDVAISRYEKL